MSRFIQIAPNQELVLINEYLVKRWFEEGVRFNVQAVLGIVTGKQL